MLILDPITEYLGKISNAGDTAEVRRILAPFVQMLRRHGIACIGISHLNKDASRAAIYRTTGSLAFVAVARAVFAVTKDKDEEDRRLMLPVKNNLGPDVLGLAYRVEVTTIRGIETTRVAWEADPIRESVDDLLAPNEPAERGSPKLDKVVEWLKAQLRKGPKRQTALKEVAHQHGFSWATVKRAKKELRVTAKKIGAPGEPTHWEWRLF